MATSMEIDSTITPYLETSLPILKKSDDYTEGFTSLTNLKVKSKFS